MLLGGVCARRGGFDDRGSEAVSCEERLWVTRWSEAHLYEAFLAKTEEAERASVLAR